MGSDPWLRLKTGPAKQFGLAGPTAMRPERASMNHRRSAFEHLPLRRKLPIVLASRSVAWTPGPPSRLFESLPLSWGDSYRLNRPLSLDQEVEFSKTGEAEGTQGNRILDFSALTVRPDGQNGRKNFDSYRPRGQPLPPEER